MKLDTKTISISIVLFICFTFSISAAHEFGHALICFEAGHSPEIILNWWGVSSYCQPDIDTLTYFITGPLVGVWLSLAVILGGHILRKRMGFEKFAAALEIVGIAIATNQALRVVLEGFMTKQYVAGDFDIGVAIYQMASLIIPMVLLATEERIGLAKVINSQKS